MRVIRVVKTLFRYLVYPGRPLESRVAASRGMTLVELLAVSVMLSILISAVLMLYSQSWAASLKDDEKLTASYIAQSVLEEWLAVHDYQTVKEKMSHSPLGRGNDNILQDIWEKKPDYETYTPKIELAYADPSRHAGPIRVTITIESKNKQAVTLHGIKTEATEEPS